MSNHILFKGLLIAMACLIGVVSGLVAGIVMKIYGSSISAAIMAGGAAFVATTGLSVDVINSLVP